MKFRIKLLKFRKYGRESENYSDFQNLISTDANLGGLVEKARFDRNKPFCSFGEGRTT